MKQYGIKAIAFISLVAVLVVNYLADALPINGITTGEVSELFPNLFVPSGITFAIWGVIYALLIAFTISILASRNASTLVLGPPFVLINLLNIGWIFAWHYQRALLSLVIMLFLFAALHWIYQLVGNRVKARTIWEKISLQAPFRVYLGWISIALVANVTTVLVYYNWGGWGISDVVWTIMVIGLATGITWLVLENKKDWLFALVILWAFLGIILKRLSVEPVIWPIIITTIICILFIVVGIYRSRLRTGKIRFTR